MQEYTNLLCSSDGRLPSCAVPPPRPDDEENNSDDLTSSQSAFYADFMLLFQVKTTKGILLFLLFCVLASVTLLTICVGFLWIHRSITHLKGTVEIFDHFFVLA